MLRRLVPALALLLVAGSPAALADVLHFTNGTAMTIRSYEVKGDMIHVVLGADSSMAFPAELVDKIERGGRTTWSKDGAANVIVPGQASSAPVDNSQRDHPVYGDGDTPARARAARPDAEVNTAVGVVPEMAGPEGVAPASTTPRGRATVVGRRAAFNPALRSTNPAVPAAPGAPNRWGAVPLMAAGVAAPPPVPEGGQAPETPPQTPPAEPAPEGDAEAENGG